MHVAVAAWFDFHLQPRAVRRRSLDSICANPETVCFSLDNKAGLAYAEYHERALRIPLESLRRPCRIRKKILFIVARTSGFRGAPRENGGIRRDAALQAVRISGTFAR